MKHFHDLSFVATWVGKKRWADTQEPVVNSTVGVQSAGKRSSCPSIWLNRAPRRHTDERRYRWHKYSLPRSASRPSRSIPDTHCTVGSVGPRARLDTWGGKKPWSIQPVVQLVGRSLYLLSYPEHKNSEHAASNTNVSGSPNRADNYAQYKNYNTSIINFSNKELIFH